MHAPSAPHHQRAFIAAAQRGFFVASDELPVRAPHAPTSLIGYFVEALNCRRTSGLEPVLTLEDRWLDLPAFLAVSSVFPAALSAEEDFRNGLARAYDGLARRRLECALTPTRASKRRS